jgi:hypothetical protein
VEIVIGGYMSVQEAIAREVNRRHDQAVRMFWNVLATETAENCMPGLWSRQSERLDARKVGIDCRLEHRGLDLALGDTLDVHGLGVLLKSPSRGLELAYLHQHLWAGLWQYLKIDLMSGRCYLLLP